MTQQTFDDKEDEFVKSLNLTEDKIKEDLEKMREIEGFPLGDVEDILELSEPPYYTAYPNPYIKEFIEYFGTPYDEETDEYNVLPYSQDQSYGRTDKVYNIHFYHTKVPPQSIKSYIEHYTKPEDIIVDFFSGSGMTGVSSLRLNRHPLLFDLSPFASFISFNNCNNIDLIKFENFALDIYNSVYNEYAYLYSVDGDIEHQRNFTVWSEIQTCPYCNNDYVFFNAESKGREIKCPHCDASLKKNKLKCKLDENGKGIFVPVEIHFINDNNKREAIPINDYEQEILKEIESLIIPYRFPHDKLVVGYNTSQPMKSHGFSHVDDFFTKRNLLVISAFFDKIENYSIDNEYKTKLKYAITAAMIRLTVLNRYMPSHNRHVGPLSGTLYVPKLYAEINPFKNIKEKINAIVKANYDYKNKNFVVSNQSSTILSNIPDNSIDYIFIDPPFGENLMYSEINFILESWIKIFTSNKDEVIINSYQNKGESEYFDLMFSSLKEGFRILKPNRWITLEFHNSKASIWRIIHESLVKAGFIIAQVVTLDKQKGTTKQLSYDGTVQNDLMINAYKPDNEFRTNFIKKAGADMELNFLKMQLNKLPIKLVIERSHKMLYSQLLAQYIQNGFEIKMDATDLYKLLSTNFIERDGYWFTSDQVEIFDKTFDLMEKIDEEYLNQTILGIDSEKTAIIWLFNFLKEPKDFTEIHKEYLKNLMVSDDDMPELKTILQDNFVIENGIYRLPSDFEKEQKELSRNKKLQKTFNEIVDSARTSKKKIKEVRKEALSFGLMNLYKEKDVDTINLLGERIDKKIIESDEDISAIIDWAKYK